MVSLEPVVKKIFEEAARLQASDIHLEPEEDHVQLRWRIGGLMSDGPKLDGALKDPLVMKLKLMARMDCNEVRRPQDGAFVVETGGQSVQVRLSTIPARCGQSVVMRLFKKAAELERLEGLGLTEPQREILEGALRERRGLVVISGPTGSGKTTTFYAALRAINPENEKIITVEDPVEQRLEGVCQTPVTPALGFADALRSILRQSPNIIGVGELRDLESARMALQAALTGHMVVATLHADSAAGVGPRLIDMGLDSAILAEVLECVVAQRLLSLRTPQGPVSTGVFEVMRPSGQVRAALKGCRSAQEVAFLLRKEGFCPMSEVAWGLSRAGKLSPEAVLSEFNA